MLDAFTLFWITLGEKIFEEKMLPKIKRLKNLDRSTLGLSVLSIMFALSLPGFIQETANGSMHVWQFFVILSGMIGYTSYHMWTKRNQVIKKARRAFYSIFTCYTYIFAATGITMYWALPFMPNTIF